LKLFIKHFLYPVDALLITATATLSNEEDDENDTYRRPRKHTGDCTNIPARLNFSTLGLLIVIAKAIMVENCLLHSLKTMVGSDGHS